jgi:hypothetical protein
MPSSVHRLEKGMVMNCNHLPGNRSPHLFPDTFYTTPLDSWATVIQRVPSKAKWCLIEQVIHYKTLSDMEHEFLVVHTSHLSGSKVMLGIDCNADVFTASQQHAPAKAVGPSSASVSSARYLSILMHFLTSHHLPSILHMTVCRSHTTPCRHPFSPNTVDKWPRIAVGSYKCSTPKDAQFQDENAYTQVLPLVSFVHMLPLLVMAVIQRFASITGTFYPYPQVGKAQCA